jgi:hypothetical protein
VASPFEFWSADRIAAITLCPEPAVREHWPIIAAALDRRGIYDRDVSMGVLGTVAIETASTFRPIHEYRNADGSVPAVWYTYDGGPEFHGRGFIQITHRSNYRAAGDALGIDLVVNPDLALDPQIAADILAWYWATKGVRAKDGSRWWSLPDLCRAHDWEWVRRVVQGGTASLGRLITIATALDASKETAMIPYNPDARVDRQPDDWSCSIQSTEFLLRSIGRAPGDQWIQDQLLGQGIVTRELGLMNATGEQLAAWITREYGSEMGFEAHHADPVTFDDVWAGAGENPTLIGGRAWNHWVGARRRNDDGTLAIANPSPGFKGVGDSISRAQWAALGPFSAVYIDRLAMGATPTDPPSVVDTRLIRARAKMLEALAILDEPVPA